MNCLPVSQVAVNFTVSKIAKAWSDCGLIPQIIGLFQVNVVSCLSHLFSSSLTNIWQTTR